MFPAYINPIGPQFVPAFTVATSLDLTWVAAAVVVGMVAVVCRVVCEEARSRDRRHRRQMPMEIHAAPREAA